MLFLSKKRLNLYTHYEHNCSDNHRWNAVMKEHLASYPYEKPSLDYMQAHIESAVDAQQSNACTLHEAWAKVPAPLNATEIQQYQDLS